MLGSGTTLPVLQHSEPGPNYPQGLGLSLIAISIGLSLILAGMDAQIVATAVPQISAHFGTVDDIGWYSSAYRLSMCSFQFMFGKLYKLLPLKPIFLSSIATFMIGSALCGAAPSSIIFILGRAVSGLGAAGVIPGCFSLLAQVIPLRSRPLATGLAGTAEGCSIIVAPIVGGLLVDHISWRWCFYINLPLGGFAFLVIGLSLATPPRANVDMSWNQIMSELDLPGTLAFIPGMVCMFVALQWAGTTYGWSNPRIIVLLGLFVVLSLLFACLQYKKQDKATLPPRIICQRTVLAGFWFSLCNNSAFNLVEYYLPTYFQTVREDSAAEAGILIIPLSVGFIVAILIGGSITSMIGYYNPSMLVTSTLLPVAAGLMSTLEVNTGLARLITYQGFFGFAAGIGFQSPQVAVQTILETEDTHIGIAIIIFAQNFGPAVFNSVAQNVFTKRLVEEIHTLAPSVDAGSLTSTGLTDVRSIVSAAEVTPVLQAYDSAITQTFYVAVAMACFSLVGALGVQWGSVKSKRN